MQRRPVVFASPNAWIPCKACKSRKHQDVIPGALLIVLYLLIDKHYAFNASTTCSDSQRDEMGED